MALYIITFSHPDNIHGLVLSHSACKETKTRRDEELFLGHVASGESGSDSTLVVNFGGGLAKCLISSLF